MIITGILTAIITIFACKKNVQDADYTGEGRIFLRGPSLGLAAVVTGTAQVAKSSDVSFAVIPSTKVDSTITLLAQNVGAIVNYDRKFAIAIDTGTTALPEEYEIASTFTIPANGYQSTIKVKLKRSARISEMVVKLGIKVVETSDFKVNPTGLNIPSPNIALQTNYAFTWTGLLVKPINWDGTFGLRSYLGVYSKLKHQLIVDQTPYGTTFETFLLNGNFTKQKYQMQSWLNTYVTSYNAANPTNQLKNESGVAIRICSGCP